MTEIHLHPLVLLSIADHKRRSTSSEIVGALMGTKENGIHIKNSFAVPYKKNKFLDTSYLQEMLDLSKKVNEEKFLGWYTASPNINGIELMKFGNDLLFLNLDLEKLNDELPVKIYRLEGNELVNVSFNIEAEEAEEVGVEHLLRGVRHESLGYGKVKEIRTSLKEYDNRLEMILNKLEALVSISEVEPNNRNSFSISDKNFLFNCQEILKQLEYINDDISDSEMIRYISSLIKTTIHMDDLVRNKRIMKCNK